MAPEITVSNTSPLIGLHQIGHIDLLRELCPTLIVPPAVAREASPSVNLPAWIVVRSLSQPISARVLQTALGSGESEAISLALELGSALVLLDDRSARRLAQGLGLQVTGTAGILLAAKRVGLVPAVRPLLDELLHVNFYIAAALYEQVLVAAGEHPRRADPDDLS